MHERNYSVSEKEYVAVVWALAMLRLYLIGTHFRVHIEHGALCWLMEISEPLGRLMQCPLRLSEFYLEVRYKKGAPRVQADALSRLGKAAEAEAVENLDFQCFTVDGAEEDTTIVSVDVCDDILVAETSELSMASFLPINPEEMIREQQVDPFCTLIRAHLDGGLQLPFGTNDQGYLGRLVSSTPQLLMPRSLQKRVLYLSHHVKFGAHPGGRKMYLTLRREFYRPAMAFDCYY